jgi:hypothetical protein
MVINKKIIATGLIFSSKLLINTKMIGHFQDYKKKIQPAMGKAQ